MRGEFQIENQSHYRQILRYSTVYFKRIWGKGDNTPAGTSQPVGAAVFAIMTGGPGKSTEYPPAHGGS